MCVYVCVMTNVCKCAHTDMLYTSIRMRVPSGGVLYLNGSHNHARAPKLEAESAARQCMSNAHSVFLHRGIMQNDFTMAVW